MAEALVFDYRKAPLTPADRALCDYAVKLTLQPARVGAEDVGGLRMHGFSDEQISIAAQVIGYFNYINRIAEGLGVEPEPWMEPDAATWQARRAQFG